MASFAGCDVFEQVTELSVVEGEGVRARGRCPLAIRDFPAAHAPDLRRRPQGRGVVPDAKPRPPVPRPADRRHTAHVNRREGWTCSSARALLRRRSDGLVPDWEAFLLALEGKLAGWQRGCKPGAKGLGEAV